MIKLSISSLVFFLSMVTLMGLNGCDHQDPPPKVAKELPQRPDTAVGGMARSAINKAKRVEPTLGEAGNRTAKTGKEGTPYARDFEHTDMADELFTAWYDSIGAIEELDL